MSCFSPFRSSFFSLFLLASLVLSLATMLPSVHAVGFMNLPTTREFVFEPGLQVDIPISVIGAERLQVSVSASTNDDIPIDIGNPAVKERPEEFGITPYLTLEDPAPGSGPRSVTLRMDLPKDLPPNRYYVYLGVTEAPSDSGAMISAVASARLRFTIWVLSPEKRVDIVSAQELDIAEGTRALTNATLVSRTTQAIDRLALEVQVLRDGQSVTSAMSPATTLASAEQTVLGVQLDTAQLDGGEYTMRYIAHYDGDRSPPTDMRLRIGALHVEVTNTTANFTFNETNRFEFTVGNRWNKGLNPVYGVVLIGGQSKQSPSLPVAAFGSTPFEVYFDRSEQLLPGVHNATVTVVFNDYNLSLRQNVSRQESFTVPIEVLAPPQTASDMTLVYIVAGAVLLVLLIILVLVLVLRRKRHAEPDVPLPVKKAVREDAAPAAVARVASKADVLGAAEPSAIVEKTAQKPAEKERG
jgi:LPXTG-motif cell wall-anchored protein